MITFMVTRFLTNSMKYFSRCVLVRGEIQRQKLYDQFISTDCSDIEILNNAVKSIHQAISLKRLFFLLLSEICGNAFNKDDSKGHSGRTVNCPSGTVVDNDIVHPIIFDFFCTALYYAALLATRAVSINMGKIRKILMISDS
ncbi:uncharacterized protein BX664DRAFT_382186 [Halteromyces radiatus]|uniref:uncharacterized protein n=1 Tax=Halteromyces radiatus TaxID=101107 RepID=UPI002221188D|nr:uncharacterized protein BX664DRAFT_382186 [Halteromyces radiatus]KAI8099685.1 hypothetical protein BX664DRAFT_382186 [Halteromyces radiatus]